MAEIWISGGVGWDLTAQSVSEQLRALNGEDVTINLNTAGGSVYEGVEIYNVLKQYRGRKTIKMGSLVASIGSYIAAAGDEVIAHDFTSYMIHEVTSWASGTSEEIKAEAERIEKLNSMVAKRLADVSGKPESEIRTLMQAETWFYGKEIVDAGFADTYEDTGRAEDREVAVAMAAKEYKRVAKLAALPEEQQRDKQKNKTWIDDAKALIESGKFNAVDDSTEVIRNGVVYRSALRRIASRAPENKSEVADLISMIDKRTSKEKKRMDKNELLEAIRREPGLTLAEIAKELNQSGRIMTDEHETALKIVKDLKAMNVDDPVAEIKANRARIEELAKSERAVAITEAFGPSKMEGGKELNLVREYAEERVPKTATGEELAKAINEVRESGIAKRLAGEMADPFSPVNRIDSKETKKTDGAKPVEY